MPSLPDTAVIILLGLLLFGPKGLAQIARQLGKLMGEFRRASNEFRMQMEEELRIAEQADRQKQILAVEAAAPVAPVAPVLASPRAEEIGEEHPHLPAFVPAEEVEPLPIATSGELNLMPPATGLPSPRSSSLGPLLESVPKADPSGMTTASEALHADEDQRPMRYTNGHTIHNPAPVEETTPSRAALTEESLHG